MTITSAQTQITEIKNCIKTEIMVKCLTKFTMTTNLKDAENHFTVDGLKETLMPDLVLLQELKVHPDQPLIFYFYS